MFSQIRKLFFATLIGMLALSVFALQPALAQWKPKKPVEFVIMAGKGGGADRLARLIQSIIQKNKFSPQPFIPVNKGGGSGAEALRYVQDKKGNPHIILATLNSYYTTPLRNKRLGVDIANFTPVARLALDTFVLWVNSETSITNLNQYLAAVKGQNGRWKMGGTGTGQEDSLVTAMLENKFGVKHTYIPYKGGGTVAKNLAGKQLDSTVNNPSEQLGFFKAGNTRPLATFTDERISIFPDTPTMKELGHDNMVYLMQRSIVAPPGIAADVEAFYVSVFKKVHESKEWVEYTNSKALNRAFLTGKSLTDFFVSERASHEKLLRSLGEIK